MLKKKNPSILIIEDELITATNLEELLLTEDYDVIGIAASAEEAFDLLKKASDDPDIILCDININGAVKGTELAATIKEQYQCEVIFITAYADQKTIANAFASEPVMYIVKPFTDTQVLVAVQMAMLKRYNRKAEQAAIKLELTEREKEIALLVAQGLTSKQVAKKLFLSVETIKTHRRKMMQKNGVSNFPHLIYLLNQKHL